MANQASAASSSSAPSTSYSHYDVFINHRGPDVKNTFATHLYRRLLEKGLRVFLDKPELQPGHPITPQIRAAIEVASVHIAIFSKTYAKSRWCLEELDLMVRATERAANRATILPVFYDVKPSDLRYTTKGAYAEALLNHEKKARYDSNTIQNWRSALSYAAEQKGFELDGDEEELLRNVVEGVLKNVSKPRLYVAKYPTGLEEKLQDFEMTMLNENKGRPTRAKVVGIVGFGGVGKTTLAKAFFNCNRSLYNGSSFLRDVREKSARGSLNDLQTQLIKDLKKDQNITIENPDEGVEILQRDLSSCHALIILDDVDNASQLDMLLPVDVLSAESLILVTTRDKHVLIQSGESSIYNMTGLNTSHSKELFCSYAFHRPLPPTELAELVDRFVKACNGLPLSLKVIGALLCGKNEQYWKDQLVRLGLTLPEEIQKTLRISYDSLCKEDQQIFLDIACFFLGGNKDRAIRIWGSVAIRNLENKCLLEEVGSGNNLRMHDHIRDCARSIAQEESMPLRLWYQTPTNVMDALSEKSSSVEIEVRGIATMAGGFNSDVKYRYSSFDGKSLFKNSEIEPLFNNSGFRGMKNLRFVATTGASLEAMLRRLHSPQLSWLRWYECSCSSLPDWIPMKNLRVLDVQGNDMESLWPEQSTGPLELRELRIIAPLSNFPKSIGQLQHLEWIDICAGNFRHIAAETLPEEFCHLRSLKYLVLNEFSNLKSLPECFGKLINLQHINLAGASRLRRLPNSFGNLTRLKYLCLRGCSNLTISNGALANIDRLEYLSLQGCREVKELPPRVAHLRSLKELNLKSTNFKELPCGIGNLCNLVTLKIGNESLEHLPSSLGHLRSLKELNLQSTNLKELPCGIGNLCNLVTLKIGNESLELLPSSLCNLKSLEKFSLKSSPKVKCLPDSFGMLTQLRQLVLKESGIEYLPQDLPKFNNLEVLLVVDCPLREVSFLRGEGEAEISSLEGGSGCNKLDSVNDKCMFGLGELILEGTQISEVAFLNGVCPNLYFLVVEGCCELKSIQGLGHLTKLNELYVIECKEIEELAGVEHCMSLELFRTRDCPKLQWGGGVLQQLRGRLKKRPSIDAIQYKRRKLCA